MRKLFLQIQRIKFSLRIEIGVELNGLLDQDVRCVFNCDRMVTYIQGSLPKANQLYILILMIIFVFGLRFLIYWSVLIHSVHFGGKILKRNEVYLEIRIKTCLPPLSIWFNIVIFFRIYLLNIIVWFDA